MQKFQKHAVTGMQIHNQREKESDTNPDIIKQQEHLNYDLLNDGKINYNEKIKEQIEKRYTGNRAIRKDAVHLCQFIVTSDKSFFDGLKPNEEKRYFQESLSFLQDRYGKENILYAMVHKDEKTPHMHVGMVPITKDGKFSAKQFFGKRSELQQLQDKFYGHVIEKGFDLERGIASDRKHIDTNRLKVLTAREQVKTLENELKEKQQEKTKINHSIQEVKGRLSDLETSLEGVKKVDEVEIKEGGLFAPRTVKLERSDFESIKILAKASEGFREANRALKIDNEKLSKENKSFREQSVKNSEVQQRYRAERDLYKGKYERLDSLFEHVTDFYRQRMPKAFKGFEQVLGYAKHQVNKGLSVMNMRFRYSEEKLTENERAGFDIASKENKQKPKERDEGRGR